MPKPPKKREALKAAPETLKGWQQIAAFLGQPTSVVQRWASEGMPVRCQGRFVSSTPEEPERLAWEESGKHGMGVVYKAEDTKQFYAGISPNKIPEFLYETNRAR